MSDNLKLCSSIKFNWLTIPCTEACCTRQEAKAPMYTHLWHYAGVHLVLSIICLCRNHQSSTCGWVVRHLSITYLWLGCRSPVKNIYLWLGCQSPVNHLPVTRPSVICGSPTCDWAIESLACDWAVSHLWITYLWLSHQSPVKSPVNHLCVIEPSVTCQSPTCDWAVSHLSITCQSPTCDWAGLLVAWVCIHSSRLCSRNFISSRISAFSPSSSVMRVFSLATVDVQRLSLRFISSWRSLSCGHRSVSQLVLGF